MISLADFEGRGCFGDSDDNGFGVLNSVRTDFFSLPTQMTYETCSEYCWRVRTGSVSTQMVLLRLYNVSKSFVVAVSKARSGML